MIHDEELTSASYAEDLKVGDQVKLSAEARNLVHLWMFIANGYVDPTERAIERAKAARYTVEEIYSR